MTLRDAVAVLGLLVGRSVQAGAQSLSPWARQAADVDRNGALTLADAVNILRHAVGLAASIDATLRVSVTAVSEAVGFEVPVTLSTGEVLRPGAPTLTVVVQDGVVSFGGSAAGRLHVLVDAQGRATFSRDSSFGTEIATTDTVVTGLFSKILLGVDALTLTLAPSDAAVQYVFNAPQATSIVLDGATGGGADEVVIRIADPHPGAVDGRALHLDTAGLAASGDTLTFRFDESARNVLSKPFDNDEVTLAASSHVNAGFSRLKVVAGIVDASSIDPQAGGYFPTNKTWEVSSGVVLSLKQLRQTEGVVSPTASGGLLVAVTSDEQAELEALLADPASLGLSGVTAGVRLDGAVSDRVWDFPPDTGTGAVLPMSVLGPVGWPTWPIWPIWPAGDESFLA